MANLSVVLTQRAHDVIDTIVSLIFLARDGDVVVGPVHSRSHEIRHARIDAHVISIDMLLVDGLGDQVPTGACDHSSVFHTNLRG